jgi:hypothetical protein
VSWAATASRLTTSCLSTIGNDVVIFDVAGKGILRSPSESIFDGVVVVTDWMLELDSAVWPVVGEGTVVTVDGTDYVAREQSRLGTDQSSIFVPLELMTGEAPTLVLNGDFL